MLSFEKCKEILSKRGKPYSDEQVRRIITCLSALVEVEIEMRSLGLPLVTKKMIPEYN